MPLTFEPVTVDGNYGDNDGVLIFRGGALLAIAVRLGEAHGPAQGRWFLEKSFGGISDASVDPFEDRHALEAWLTSQTQAMAAE
jgi:hypothetical protein